MAIDFPANPGAQTPVNTFSPSSTPLANTTNSVTFLWDGTKWTAAGSGGGGSSDPVHFEGPTPPTAPTLKATDQWFNTDDGRLYTYTLDDAGNLKWVDASPDSQTSLLWERTGTTLEPTNAGDDVDLGTGDLSAASAVLTANAISAAIDVKNAQDSNKRTFLVTGSGDLQIGDDLSNAPKVSLGPGGNILTRSASAGAAFQVRNSADDSAKVNVYGSGDVHIGGSLPASPNITLSASGDIAVMTYVSSSNNNTAGATLYNSGALYLANKSGNNSTKIFRSYTNGVETSYITAGGAGYFPGGTAGRNVSINLEPDNPANYTTEEVDGEEVQVYTGPTLDVKEKLLDFVARIEALEATNASLEARLTALEGGTN